MIAGWKRCNELAGFEADKLFQIPFPRVGIAL